MRYMQALLAIGLALIAFSCIGCGGGKSFTPEEFKKITKGMIAAQVTEIVGKPKEVVSGKTSGQGWYYQVGDKYYLVGLKDGKVEDTGGPWGKQEYDFSIGLAKEMIKHEK